MGRLSAIDMIDHAPDIRQALTWHLTANHYPPVPPSMVDACVEAIDAIGEGDPDRLIELPEFVTFKGRTDAPAYSIAEGHHLDVFIEATW